MEKQWAVERGLRQTRSANEIASRLQVSVKTIETHRRNIMDKLGVHSVAEFTKYAIGLGLTYPEP